MLRELYLVIESEVFFRPGEKCTSTTMIQWLIDCPGYGSTPGPVLSLTHARALFGYSVEDWHAARTSDDRLSIRLRYRIDPSSGGDPPPHPPHPSPPPLPQFCASSRVNLPPLTAPLLQLHKLNYYKKSGTSVSYCRAWSISRARGNYNRHRVLKQRCVI